MANNLTFDQAAVLMKAVLEQVQGKTAIQTITLDNFVSVGQTLLKAGYDPLLNAISVVLGKTYFSIRPYRSKFDSLYVDEAKWGVYARKLTAVDKDPVNNQEYFPENGAGVDMYAVNKTIILQVNFYGGATYSRDLVIWKNQLDLAFTNPQELANFWSMLYQNLDDMVEQDRETQARMAIVNFIAGKAKGDAANVIHLVQVYNDETGLDLTSETVRQPDNWKNFVLWALAYIKTLSDMMTERSQKFHINVTGKEVMRHTPLERQAVFLLAKEGNAINTRVMSQSYHDEYLNKVDFKTVGYWQSIDTPAGIKAKPTFLKADGSLETAATEFAGDVFGVIFDKEAIVCAIVNEWSAVTPLNARGGYSVRWDHYTCRWMNDFTENGVVLMLD